MDKKSVDANIPNLTGSSLMIIPERAVGQHVYRSGGGAGNQCLYAGSEGLRPRLKRRINNARSFN